MCRSGRRGRVWFRPEVDHVGNAADLSRFAGETFEQIYASHILEHFDYQHELVPTLQEGRRMLTPAGGLLISVPDLDILAKMVVAKEHLNSAERFEVMQMILARIRTNTITTRSD